MKKSHSKVPVPKTVKTAISIDRRLFEAGERTAQRFKVSRSRLYAAALEELLKKHNAKALAAAIDAATSAEEDDDVREFRQLAARRVFQTLAAEEDEPW